MLDRCAPDQEAQTLTTNVMLSPFTFFTMLCGRQQYGLLLPSAK